MAKDNETTPKEPVISMGKSELQDFLKEIVRASKTPNAAEMEILKQKWNKELKREQFGLNLLQGERDSLPRDARLNCTHCTYSAAHGKRGGEMCAPGHGDFRTSGQLLGSGDTALLMCLRCHTEWIFKVDAQTRENIVNGGMDGWAPPAPELIVSTTAITRDDLKTNQSNIDAALTRIANKTTVLQKRISKLEEAESEAFL